MKQIIILLYSWLLICHPILSQNVGIGTLTPTRAKLEVVGAAGFTSAIFGGDGTGISLQRNWPAIGFNQYYDGNSRRIGNGCAAAFYLDAGGGYMELDMFPSGTANTIIGSSTLALSINNNGNTGIKTYPTDASLTVVRGGNYEGTAVFAGTNYNSHFCYSDAENTYIRAGKPNSTVYINDIAGGRIIMGAGNSQVGINNGVPVYTLEIRQVGGKGMVLVEPVNSFNNWELRLQQFAPSSVHSNMNLVYNGQYKGFFHYSTGNYTVYSDSRLKTGIQRLPTLLDKVMQLNPVEYEMKYHNESHEKTTGFLAQDVKRLFPELVTITTDTSRGYPGITDLHGLNYNGFVVLTIKAIQEQQQLILKMQQQNKQLAKRIEQAEKLSGNIHQPISH